MRSRAALVAALAVVLAGSTLHVGAQPKTTITLWYPAGDVAAGPVSPLHDPALFQPFEATSNVHVELVGLDYDTMEQRSEEHTSELQSRENLVCRLLLEKKKREADEKHDPGKASE